MSKSNKKLRQDLFISHKYNTVGKRLVFSHLIRVPNLHPPFLPFSFSLQEPSRVCELAPSPSHQNLETRLVRLRFGGTSQNINVTESREEDIVKSFPDPKT